MNTRNGDSGSRRRRSLDSRGASSDGKKKSGKKMEKKAPEKDDTSSVGSTARTTRSRSLIGHEQSRTPVKDRNGVNENSSREPSQEPVKRKRGRPPKNSNVSNVSNASPAKRSRGKRKVVSKYFQDKSSDEEEEKSNYDESKNAKKTNRKKESPVEELIRIKSINDSELSSNRPSRRSSRVSSSTASSALSSILSVKNVSKKTNKVEKRPKVSEQKFTNGKSEQKLSTKKLNKKLNEKLSAKKLNKKSKKKRNEKTNGSHSVEESEDECQPEENGSEDESEELEEESEEEKVIQVAAFSKRKPGKGSNQNHNQVTPMTDVGFHGYSRQVSLLRSLIRSAVDQVESNTVLIVGSSGVGKSALIDHCLEAENGGTKCTILRLNGFIETDENLAFKSLNNQLDNKGTNSIPDVMGLLTQEDSAAKDRKPFVILLDKFDTFCRKDQYLIYNLFDCTRRCNHILVIGTTSRIDVQELLEKRVKSRMNQIMIHLASPFQDFDDYLLFAKALLESNRGSLPESNRGSLPESNRDSLPEEWIPSLKQLYSRTQSVREVHKFILQRNFSLLRSSSMAQSSQSSSFSLLRSSSMGKSSQSSSQSSEEKTMASEHRLEATVHYLTSLSYLELAILVSVFKSSKSRNIGTFTTSTVMKLASFLPSQMVHDRSMLFKVINNLIDYGFFYLITPINAKASSCMNEKTHLGINVDERTLKSTLISIQNSIPSNLKNLLTL